MCRQAFRRELCGGALILFLCPLSKNIVEAAVVAPPSATLVACIAKRQMTDYAAAYGTPPERMFLLPPGMDPACKRPPESEALAVRHSVRAKLGAGDGDIVVLLVSNSIRNKGTDRAIAALGALPDDAKRRLVLWVVGRLPDGELRDMLRRAGIEERTKVLGQTDGVRDFMLGADLFLHPARNEAAGSALVEALAAGLPVLTTDICGFAPYVNEATGTVLEGEFRQEALEKMLADMLPRLDELKRMTLDYARKMDFCSRARVFADALEGFRR